MTRSRHSLIAVLDIGTSKICCLIAERDDAGQHRVLGIGHQVARGLKYGSIVEMEAARAAVRAAVHAAEEMADHTISEVIVNVSAGRPRTQLYDAEVPVAGHEVGSVDLRRVLDQGYQWRNGEDREIIHAIPTGYIVDGQNGVRDPRGMFAQKLGVEMNLVTATTSAVRNLTSCVAGCHLSTRSLVVSPYAAALSCLVDDEKELGATVIDMGGGVTSIAVFEFGELAFVDTVPVGGHHVTTDVAHGLSTPLAQAERIKTLHGTAVPSAIDDRRMIDVPPLAEDGGEQSNQVPRSELTAIIEPRIEETFELVRDHLQAASRIEGAGRRIVLTGGASMLQGAREVAGRILGAHVRLGRPAHIAGLADAAGGPAFAVATGLLHHALLNDEGGMQGLPRRTGEQTGLFGRIGHWLHENF